MNHFKILSIYFHKKVQHLIHDTKFKEILHGSSLIFTARVLSSIFGLFVNIIIARYYGPRIMGILAIINSILIISSIFSLLGTNASLSKYIPEHLHKYSFASASNLYKKALKFTIFSSIVFSLILFFSSKLIAISIINKPRYYYFFIVSAIFLISRNIHSLNMGAIRALKKIKLLAFSIFFINFFKFCCLSFVTLFFFHIYNPLYIHFLSITTLFLITTYFLKNLIFHKKATDEKISIVTNKNFVTTTIPMFFITSMYFFLPQISIFLLGILTTERDVGIYTAAFKISTLISFFYASINSIAAPKFSELYHSGKIEELFYIAKKSSKLLFYSTAPVSLFLLIFGKILLNIFGKDFVTAYPTLIFLLIGQFVHSLTGSAGHFLNMTGQHIISRNIIIFAIALHIILNFLLISPYGIIGAAIANMISISLWRILSSIFVKLKFGFSIFYFPFISK